MGVVPLILLCLSAHVPVYKPIQRGAFFGPFVLSVSGFYCSVARVWQFCLQIECGPHQRMFLKSIRGGKLRRWTLPTTWAMPAVITSPGPCGAAVVHDHVLYPEPGDFVPSPEGRDAGQRRQHNGSAYVTTHADPTMFSFRSSVCQLI